MALKVEGFLCFLRVLDGFYESLGPLGFCLGVL